MVGNAREQTGLRRLKGRPGLGEVIRAVERIKGEKWALFRDRHADWGRDMVLYLGRKECGLKLLELGDVAGGIDYVTVSAVVRRFGARLRKDRTLEQALSQARELLKM
jgi:chromosomal replication initiation ATPase DnaA